MQTEKDYKEEEKKDDDSPKVDEDVKDKETHPDAQDSSEQKKDETDDNADHSVKESGNQSID